GCCAALFSLLEAPVQEQVEPELAGRDDVDAAVAVDVDHGELAAERRPLAGSGDRVAREAPGLALPPVVVDARRLGCAGIASLVGPDALSGDELLAAVAVEVGQREHVRLRPRLVDHVLLPHRRAVRPGRLLPPPVEAVVVAAAE